MASKQEVLGLKKALKATTDPDVRRLLFPPLHQLDRVNRPLRCAARCQPAGASLVCFTALVLWL